jgi:hypothetical protein
LLGIPVDSYFDDFWAIDFAQVAQSGFEAFIALHAAICLTLKRRKEMRPASTGLLLGIRVSVRRIPFRATVDKDRRARLSRSIREVLTADTLTSGEASTLAGRLNFAGSAVFGAVGRGPLHAVYMRQWATKRPGWALGLPHGLTPGLREALRFFLVLLIDPPPRIVPQPGKVRRHVSLFTDGAGDGHVGAVLLREGMPALAFADRVPCRTRALLQERKQQIALIELLVVLMAVEAFADEIQGRDVILWIDNVVAEAAVRNGFLRRDSVDGCALASALWLSFMRLRVTAWVERVPTDLNIADGPSRPREPAKLAPLLALPTGVQWRRLERFPVWIDDALERACRALQHDASVRSVHERSLAQPVSRVWLRRHGEGRSEP